MAHAPSSVFIGSSAAFFVSEPLPPAAPSLLLGRLIPARLTTADLLEDDAVWTEFIGLKFDDSADGSSSSGTGDVLVGAAATGDVATLRYELLVIGALGNCTGTASVALLIFKGIASSGASETLTGLLGMVYVGDSNDVVLFVAGLTGVK